MTQQQQPPITGYRVFFDTHWEDFPDVDSAWKRRCEYMEQTGGHCYVHTLYLGGPEYPVITP